MEPAKDARQPISFLDLPAELRDNIYLYSCPYKWFDIVHMKDKILQPNASMVCRQMREESLEIFYSKGVWLLDLRDWQHPQDYPPTWTPSDIFMAWIHAIGDSNAARLKRLIIYHRQFTVNFTINSDAPKITARIRKTSPGSGPDIAEDAPSDYNFKTAIHRAERRLQFLIDQMNSEVGFDDMTSRDFQTLYDIVESIKPALCARNGIGWKGAFFREAEVVTAMRPTKGFEVHRRVCDDCEFRRP